MNAPAPLVTERTRAYAIAAAIGSISAVGMSLSLGLPLLAIVLEQRGISSSAIGLNTAVAGVASLVTTPFVTRLARAVGAARLLLASCLMATVVFPLFYVAEAFWLWFPLRFLFHAAVNTAFILSEFWINAFAPPGRRGLLMGIYATVLSLGLAVGPVILGLAGASGALPFAIGTAMLALSVLPVLAALKAEPAMEDAPRRSFLGYLALVPLATFAALTMGATESGIMSFMAIYGLRLGLPEATAALLVSAFAIGNVVAQIPLGMLSDRVDRRRLLLAIAVVGAVGSLAVPAAGGSLPLLFATLGLCGAAIAGLYTVGLTHLGARLQGTDLAAANAAFIFMYAVGQLVGPAAMGAGMDAIGPSGLPFVSAAFLAAYAVFAVLRIARTPHR